MKGHHPIDPTFGARASGVRALLSTVFACMAAACGSDDPATKVAEAFCSAYERCDCPGFPNPAESREDCEDEILAELGDPRLEVLQQTYPGVEFKLDPSCRDDLVAWADGLQCDASTTHPTACWAWHCIGNIYSGPRAVGEPCEVSAECQPGLFCDGPTGALVCRDLCLSSKSPLGGPCGEGEPACEDGLECLAGACAQPGVLGAACESGTCGEHLYCAGADGCQEMLDDGAACTENVQCRLGCTPEGTCAVGAQLGEPCDVSGLTVHKVFCAEGLSCFAGTCSEVAELCAAPY